LSIRLQELAAASADDELQLQAHHSAWATHHFAGEPALALDHCEGGRRLYDRERHRSHRLLYGGHDPGVCAANTGAKVHWLLGYPEKGVALGRSAVALAEAIADPFSLVLALQFNAILHLDRSEPDPALRRIGAAEAIAREQQVAFTWEPRLLRGAALIAQRAFEEAVACLREGLAGRLGATRSRLYGLPLLAEALAQHGEHGAALAAAREGLEAQSQSGQFLYSAELHRLEGIALWGLNRTDEAEDAFAEALRVARAQQAKAYELRAAASLAQLWGEQGRRAQARDLLAPVYGWFTEGFDTANLKEAKALLDQLA
jgi:tetratricopeptide (TPR) repeat protein